MEIINVNKPSMPEQVQANTENIKLLADRIQDVYVANVELNNNATTINSLNIKNWNTQATTGFILDTTGKLFKIVAVSDNIIYIEYWSTLVQGPQGPIGPQGPQGPIGPQGPRGNDGAGVADITRINMQVGEPNVIYDTEDGITVLAQGNIQTDTGSTSNPETEMNIPLIAGNGLTMDATEDGKHIDVHLSAETQQTLARTLKTPMSIPTEDEVVGIGTNGAQILIDKKDLIQSNPNLLINGDFRVNQRGQTIYSRTSGRIYTADRWGIWSNNCTFNVETKTLTNLVTSGNAIMSQYIEDSEALFGKTLTLSANINNGIRSVTGTVGQNYNSATSDVTIFVKEFNNLFYIRAIWDYSRQKIRIDIGCTPTGNNIVIDYVKLEIGNVATPFSIRPYAEELTMCQRYYQKLRVHDNQYCANVNAIYPNINLIQTLRKVPTINVVTYPSIRGNGANLGIVDNLTADLVRDNILMCTTNASSLGVVVGQIYSITNGEITADAEF